MRPPVPLAMGHRHSTEAVDAMECTHDGKQGLLGSETRRRQRIHWGQRVTGPRVTRHGRPALR
jgi:hypothetical protein